MKKAEILSTSGVKIPVTLSRADSAAGAILKIDGPALVPFAPTTISITAQSAAELAFAILLELEAISPMVVLEQKILEQKK